MPSAFESVGGQTAPTKYAPLFSDTFFTGLWTQRNPLRDAATPFIQRKFYGATRYESLIDGLNMEMSPDLTVTRRAGLSVYNSQTFPAIRGFYEFRRFGTAEQIQLIADTPSGPIYDATGPNTQTLIFTKSSAAGDAFFQGIGNVLYFGDGVEEKKYLPVFQLVQNWGISIAAAQFQLIANTGASGGGIPGTGWSFPGNVASNVGRATSTTSSANASQALVGTNYGFTVLSSDTVTGVSVNFNTASNVLGSPFTVQLTYNGVAIGSPKQFEASTTFSSYTFGSFTDLWGTGFISPAAVNSSTFGFQLTYLAGPTAIVQANHFQITVYTGAGAFSANHTGSGAFSATSGYQYVYAYGNSLNGGLSTASVPSNNTGVFTNAAYVTVSSIVPPLDPQVNQIRVFRTKDGGSTFFELPTSPYPATTTTLNDSAPDSTLNLFSQAPLAHINDPPPSGFNRPTYHAGRMWGAVNNVVFYSRALDQSIPGVPVESFPPANNFVFPSTVVRLIPTIFGLIVFLVSDIWLIQGDGSSTPFNPVTFVPIFGLGNYYGITQNGALLYLYTSDRQFVSLDANAGLSEIGFPVGDKIQLTYNPQLAQATYHPGGSSDKAVFLTDGSTQWYRLSPVTAPEQGQMFSPVAKPVGGFSAVQSVEQTGGEHVVLVAPASSGPILKRDTTVVTDSGTSYPCFITMGSIVLAPPGQLAELGFIAADYKGAAEGGSAPAVSVLLDDTSPLSAYGTVTSGSFETLSNFVNEPPTLPASIHTVGSRWYFSQGADPAWCRHMQIKLSWGSTATFDEILSYTLYGATHKEKQ